MPVITLVTQRDTGPSESRFWPSPVSLPQPADPVQLQLTADALEMWRTGDRPVETCRVADSLPRSFSDKHSAGTRHAGDAACDVDGAAEPVAGAADGLSGRHTNPKSGQSLLGGGCDQVKGGVQQRNRVGAHQHDGVADRLDEPHRIDRNIASKVGEPAGDVFQLLRRECLAKTGEGG